MYFANLYYTCNTNTFFSHFPLIWQTIYRAFVLQSLAKTFKLFKDILIEIKSSHGFISQSLRKKTVYILHERNLSVNSFGWNFCLDLSCIISVVFFSVPLISGTVESTVAGHWRMLWTDLVHLCSVERAYLVDTYCDRILKQPVYEMGIYCNDLIADTSLLFLHESMFSGYSLDTLLWWYEC